MSRDARSAAAEAIAAATAAEAARAAAAIAAAKVKDDLQSELLATTDDVVERRLDLGAAVNRLRDSIRRAGEHALRTNEAEFELKKTASDPMDFHSARGQKAVSFMMGVPSGANLSHLEALASSSLSTSYNYAVPMTLALWALLVRMRLGLPWIVIAHLFNTPKTSMYRAAIGLLGLLSNHLKSQPLLTKNLLNSHGVSDDLIKELGVLSPSKLGSRGNFSSGEGYLNMIISSLRQVIEQFNARLRTFALIGERWFNCEVDKAEMYVWPALRTVTSSPLLILSTTFPLPLHALSCWR